MTIALLVMDSEFSSTDGQRPRVGRDQSTRREFLRSLGLTATGLHIGTNGLPLRAPTSTGALQRRLNARWQLTAFCSPYTFAEGTTVPYYRYKTLGDMRGKIPFFEEEEGSAVEIEIENNLPIPFRPTLLGVLDGPTIPPGEMATLAFDMPPAGTYLLGSAPRRSGARRGGAGFLIGLPGLSGVLVSRPPGGTGELWTGGPTYDREYVLLYEDVDTRVSFEPTQGAYMGYEPNFFTVNGLAFPDTAGHPHCQVAGNLGERILIRMGNLGRMRQSIHFHGFHVQIVAMNALPESFYPPKDTIPVPSESTTDVILTAHQSGLYPLHPHSLTAVTANGSYPYGQLVLIDIT